MQNLKFSLRWIRNRQHQIDAIPDDILESFAPSTNHWVETAKTKTSQNIKKLLIQNATEMYKLHTEDHELKELRHAPVVWMNYHFDHDGGLGGHAQLIFLFKQDNNGNSYRMGCELGYEEIVALLWERQDDTAFKDMSVNIYPELRDKNDQHIQAKGSPVTMERAEAFIMPFGKYKGMHLTEMPREYMEWFIEHTDHKNIHRMMKLIID